MDNKPDSNLFREVHRKVREIRDKVRKDQNEAAGRSQKFAEEEAQREGFDRPTSLPPSEGEGG